MDVSEAEVARLAPQFARILSAFEALAALEVPAGLADVPANEPRTRPDTPRPSLDAARLLDRAPAREDDHYSVPKTIETAPEGSPS